MAQKTEAKAQGLDLFGRVALVTGAAGKRGIGRAIAVRLAQGGADLVVSDVGRLGSRLSEDDRIEGWRGLADVKAEIERFGRRCLAVEADISAGDQVDKLFDATIARFGHIDILVNNAAIIGPRAPLVEVEEKDFKRVLDVNIVGTYLCCRAAAKKMMSSGHGGKIINVSSLMGKMGGIDMAPYSASKFAVIGLTQSLALELAKFRVNVNSVCPGYIASEIGIGATIREDMRKGMSLEDATGKAYGGVVSQIPLGRAGQPEDVAETVAFLASSASDFLTGQAVNVNGGSMMCH